MRCDNAKSSRSFICTNLWINIVDFSSFTRLHVIEKKNIRIAEQISMFTAWLLKYEHSHWSVVRNILPYCKSVVITQLLLAFTR